MVSQKASMREKSIEFRLSLTLTYPLHIRRQTVISLAYGITITRALCTAAAHAVCMTLYTTHRPNKGQVLSQAEQ